LRRRLKRSKLSLDGVTFAVREGTVTWSGSVSVTQRKGAATRLAKSAGATRVINQLRTPHSAGGSGPKPAPREVRVGAIPPKRP
jgi:hypothetical protein